MRRWVNIGFCRFRVVMMLRGVMLGSETVEGGFVALRLVLVLCGICEV